MKKRLTFTLICSILIISQGGNNTISQARGLTNPLDRKVGYYMSKYTVFDNNTGAKFSCHTVKDVHAAIWESLERLGFSENQILDIFDNQMWNDNGVHILRNDIEIMF